MRPDTVGRCGCVVGNKWSVICGLRISGGSGEVKSVGRRSCSVDIAVMQGAISYKLVLCVLVHAARAIHTLSQFNCSFVGRLVMFRSSTL